MKNLVILNLKLSVKTLVIFKNKEFDFSIWTLFLKQKGENYGKF